MLIGGVTVLSGLLSLVWVFTSGGFSDASWLWRLPLGFLGAFAGQAVLIFCTLWILTATIRLDREQEEDSKFYRWLDLKSVG